MSEASEDGSASQSQPEEDEDISQDTEDADETREEDQQSDEDAEEEEEDEAPRRRRTAPRPPRDYRHLRIKASPKLPLLDDPAVSTTVREIGGAASWRLSTAKPGNGVDQIRDGSNETYWQSDGLQPHFINIQFPRRQTVSAIALYMDFNLDESYTPKKLKIMVGTTFHNLEQVRQVDVREPVGWVTIPLWRKWGEDPLDNILDPIRGEEDPDDLTRRRVPAHKRAPLRTHMVQVCIISMHQNGRDTHVRQVMVFGPRDYGNAGGGSGGGGGVVGRSGTLGEGRDEAMFTGRLRVPDFQTVGMSQFSVIR